MTERYKTEIKVPETELNAQDQRERLFQKLLDDAPLLETEDKALYRGVVETVISELKPQSMLELLAIKDIADKRFEEWRYRRTTAKLIDKARAPKIGSRVPSIENNIIHNYLPQVTTLSRIEANCANSRRASEKDLRRMIRDRKEDESPPIAPENKGPEEPR
jgi:hypothetical protein